MVQRELGCLKRVLHQVDMVAHVVRSTELFGELDDFLDRGLSSLVQVCDVEEVAPGMAIGLRMLWRIETLFVLVGHLFIIASLVGGILCK